MSKSANKYLLLFTLVVLFSAPQSIFGEENGTVKRYFNAVLGGGIGMYFNNMQTVPNDAISKFLPNASLKLYWQTEYRLKLGIETGYYPFYSAKAVAIDGIRYDSSTSMMTVIPIFLNVDMRVIDNFHLSLGTGFADMIYTVKGNAPTVSGSQISMANFSLGAAYYWPLTKKLDLGAEVKYLYLGKTEDKHLSLQVSLSYKVFEFIGKKR